MHMPRTFGAVILLGGCSLLGGCFRLLTQPRYENTVVGPSDGKAVNIEELVTRFPELDGIVISAPDYWEELERKKLEAAEEGREASSLTTFVVEPNYLITVEVWGEPEVTRQVYVRTDGVFDFPLIGEVQAAGKTIQEIKAEMIQRLRKFFRDPQVIVNATPAGNSGIQGGGGAGTITVLGLHSSNVGFTGKETIMQVLAASGGVPEDAEWRQIRIIRRDPSGKSRGQIIIVDYWAFARYADIRQNIPLRQNDIVFIPKHWTWGEQFAHDWSLAFQYLGGIGQIKGVRTSIETFSESAKPK